MLGMMHISVEEYADCFTVNGVVLQKCHISAMFPETADQEKALAKYLAIVPFLADKGAHFLTQHKLSEQAEYGVRMAPKLVAAIGITDENTIPFMLFCFQQAGEDVQSMGKLTREAFGECSEPARKNDGNVIQFRPRDQTVH